MKGALAAILLALLGSGPVLAAPSAAGQHAATVDAATSVLDQIMHLPARRIPHRLLSNAHGIAIIPNVVKGGFVIGIRHGKGVVLVRDAAGAWQPPQFIALTGGSVGFQAGVQATDVILVFKTRKSVEGLLNGKFTIGGDAAAAAGPVGRQASAATDAQLRAEIYSYSRSRGFFAGVSLDGSVIEVDQLANTAYYSTAPNGLPPSAGRLLSHVAAYTAGTPPAAAEQMGPEPIGPGARTGASPTVAAPQTGPTLAPAGHADQWRSRLAEAAGQLQPLLDASWQAYLALPAEVYSRTDHPSLEALAATRNRYEMVVSDPSYASLTSRTEFKAVRALLEQYLVSLSSHAAKTISLPPPPATGDAPTQRR